MRGVMVLFGKRGREGRPLLREAGELRPSAVAEAITHAFDITSDARGAMISPASPPADMKVARRTPFFCSGCPHNRSTKLPAGAQAYPGIGCHFMASWMQRDTAGLVQMGGEGVNWIGRSAYTRRGHMFQNLGDGTYFHSGLIAIRAAVAAKVNITYKILYNDAVAMTGGQPIDGSLRVEDIVAQLRGEGVGRIAVVSENPARFRQAFDHLRGVSLHARGGLMSVQEELQAIAGVTVIVYDQACAAEKRRKRKKKQLEEPARRVFINQAVCEGCGDCSRTSNCISIMPRKTEWGVKRQIDQSSCNKDFSCAEGFCPSFISISGSEKPATGDDARRKSLLAHATDLAAPSLPSTGEIVVAGVGGTGIVTVGAVLAMAAHLEGKGSTVLDFMGFAQKGGAVVSHLKVGAARAQARPVRIGAASATAVIACDLVVATMPDALGTMAAGRTHTVCNVDTLPTGDFVTRGIADMEEWRRVRLLEERGSRVTSLHASRVAIDLFGDSVYSNMLLAGAAWQKGLLPISLPAIERAITLNGRSVDQNKEAFQIGRVLADNPELALESAVEAETIEPDVDSFIEKRAAFLQAYQNAAYARRFLDFVAGVRRVEAPLGETRLTRTVAANLSRLMAFKDEYEVARLLLQDDAFQSAARRFEAGARVRFHLAPPALSFLKTRSGMPCKIAIPASIGVKLFKLLRFMRPLRGTFADPFGFSHERREAYRLIDDYEALITRLLSRLSPSTLNDIVKIANLVDDVRGYGHVRRAAIGRYKAAIEEQLRSAGLSEAQECGTSGGPSKYAQAGDKWWRGRARRGEPR
jgi:indolepyruvate ferredoxin oxidoreductase